MPEQECDSWTWAWTCFQFSLLEKDIISRLTRNYSVPINLSFSKTVSKLENIYFLQQKWC